MARFAGDIEQGALFRYSLIVPALNETFTEKSRNEYFVNIANKEHELPDGTKKYFCVDSIKRWYYLYKKYGFDGLKQGYRKDRGISKKIPISILDTVEEIRRYKRHITKRELYEELCSMGELNRADVAESTFYRFLSLHEEADIVSGTECKAYEAASANDIWQADTSQVMRIKVNNKLEVVYLVQIIDDASRLIVGQSLTFHDNAVFFQKVLKKAVKTYGIPKVLYVDNGSPYVNEQLSLICASLGIHLVHAKPYSPRGKGKVERCFRTVKDGFFNTLDWNTINDIEQAQSMYNEYLDNSYFNVRHSAINMTPKQRFMNDYENISRKNNEQIDECFLHRIERLVKNDSTISFNNIIYEVPQQFIKKRIAIKYNPEDLSCLYIYNDKNERLYTIKGIDKISNSKYKRQDIVSLYRQDGDNNV